MAKSLDQHLAETGRQSTLDQLSRDFKLDEARSEFSAGRGAFIGSPQSQSSSSSAPSFNFNDTVQQAIKMQQEAMQPAIQSLQASVPEVQSRFETTRQQTSAQIEPLKERYANLLADVKGQGKTREESQTRVTAGELGKRGITGSSTLAQQEIQNAVDPIRSSVQGATRDIGLAQEEGITSLNNILANLTSQETDSLRAVTNAIAQLQAGGAQTGITQGIQQGQYASTLAESQAQAAQTQANADRSAQLAQNVFDQINLPESKANIANVNSTIANRGGSGSGFGDLSSYLNNNQNTQQIASYEPTGFSNVDKLLGQGRWAEARQLLLNP